MSEIQQQIWRFLRGDMPTSEFEEWVYNTPELETIFDSDSYMTLISTDYKNAHAVDNAKSSIKSMVEKKFPRKCDCPTWNDEQEILMGFETADLFETYETLSSRTPWLDLVRCPICETCWYLATDTSDDVYYLLRLSAVDIENILKKNQWPDRFDNLKHVWPRVDHQAQE